MTDAYSSSTPPEQGATAADAAGVAKEQAAQVGHGISDSAKTVAGTAKEEVGRVAGESKKQAKALYEESRQQLTEQAGVQQQRIASGLRDIGGELTRMADSVDQPGIASDVVSQVATRTSNAAAWLDGRDPGSLLQEVKNFARSKPGTFILVSAVGGLVAGRLVRSLASEAHDEKAEAEPTAPAAATQPVPPTYATSSPVPPAYGTSSTETIGSSTGTPVYDATRNDGRPL